MRIDAAVFYMPLVPRWQRKSLRYAARFPMPIILEQSDFAHAKSFVLCIFLPTKPGVLKENSAVHLTLKRNRPAGVGQSLFSVSCRKRYNTLETLQAKSCVNGDAISPTGKPEPRECSPPPPIYFPLKW